MACTSVVQAELQSTSLFADLLRRRYVRHFRHTDGRRRPSSDRSNIPLVRRGPEPWHGCKAVSKHFRLDDVVQMVPPHHVEVELALVSLLCNVPAAR